MGSMEVFYILFHVSLLCSDYFNVPVSALFLALCLTCIVWRFPLGRMYPALEDTPASNPVFRTKLWAEIQIPPVVAWRRYAFVYFLLSLHYPEYMNPSKPNCLHKTCSLNVGQYRDMKSHQLISLPH